MEGQDSIPSVLGPLSISLSGVKAFVKAVVDLKPWNKDPVAVRKPWDEEQYRLSEHGHGKDLVFAILWDNGHVVPHPPITRGLEMTKNALIDAGYRGKCKPYLHRLPLSRSCVVVDWAPFPYEKICINLVSFRWMGNPTQK